MKALFKRGLSAQHRERGATLVVALVLLVAMMLAGVAVFRSVDTASYLSANISFKRDLDNRASGAINPVLTMMATAAFSEAWDYDSCTATGKSEAGCVALWKGWSYSPRLLATNGNGVPSLLADIKWTASDATPASTFDTLFAANAAVSTASKTRTRYLIERMCTDDAPASEENCILAGAIERGGSQPKDKAGAVPLPLFRVTARVEGPRNSVSFAQAVVTVKDE